MWCHSDLQDGKRLIQEYDVRTESEFISGALLTWQQNSDNADSQEGTVDLRGC